MPGCGDDGRITAAVQSKLAEDPSLSGANQIYAQTRNHVVYLSGLVDTPFEQQQAEALARQIPGVTQVVDQIGLAGGAH
jgi:osmotically-inducible protein OsmY